ncbi:hypothetical protein [Nostoc sp.]|uniref:hypothetical protein n=1 Tax=Nostoc sp. TaxID=1180 RepID=UPI002FF9062B
MPMFLGLTTASASDRRRNFLQSILLLKKLYHKVLYFSDTFDSFGELPDTFLDFAE